MLLEVQLLTAAEVQVERLYQEVTQKALGVVQYTEARKSKLYQL